MQSVMLVRSHHKHTHLVGRSLPVDFFLLLFLIHSSVVTPKQKVTARASGHTICSFITPRRSYGKVSSYIVSGIDLRVDLVWISEIHWICSTLIIWHWVRSGCAPNLSAISSTGKQMALAAAPIIFLDFQKVVSLPNYSQSLSSCAVCTICRVK